MATKDPITAAQVAERHGKSVRTIHRLAASGALPYVVKLPTAKGAYLFDPTVVDEYFAERATA